MNKGRRYPADPPRVEEIVAIMRQAGTDKYGPRLRGLIVVLWRAGVRISEALALTESDLEITRGSMLVRRGKGGRRREVGMDEWAWDGHGTGPRGGAPLPPARPQWLAALAPLRPEQIEALRRPPVDPERLSGAAGARAYAGIWMVRPPSLHASRGCCEPPLFMQAE